LSTQFTAHSLSWRQNKGKEDKAMKENKSTKKTYDPAEIEVIKFDNEEIITESEISGNEDD